MNHQKTLSRWLLAYMKKTDTPHTATDLYREAQKQLSTTIENLTESMVVTVLTELEQDDAEGVYYDMRTKQWSCVFQD